MGRKSFDKNEVDGGRGDSGPFGDTPCFVVTHHEPTTSHPPIYTFVTLLGGGTPLFATLDSAIRLERTRALATPAATHLEFRIVR